MFSVTTAFQLTQTVSLTSLNFSTTFAQCVRLFDYIFRYWSSISFSSWSNFTISNYTNIDFTTISNVTGLNRTSLVNTTLSYNNGPLLEWLDLKTNATTYFEYFLIDLILLVSKINKRESRSNGVVIIIVSLILDCNYR